MNNNDLTISPDDIIKHNGHVHTATIEPVLVKGIDPEQDQREENLIEDLFSIDEYKATEINDGSPEQYAKVKQAITDLLTAFNVNFKDPNYTKTPDRVAKAYMDYWANGYARDPKDEVTVFPNVSGYDDMVIVKDMQFYSLCSHHLAQISGYGAIAYIPNKKLLGLSKLGRVLDIYARRFQLQERLGAQVADTIMELIEPKGVMVVLYDVEHGCMSSRGVKLHESRTTTSSIRGVFMEPPVRAEALSLMGFRR